MAEDELNMRAVFTEGDVISAGDTWRLLVGCAFGAQEACRTSVLLNSAANLSVWRQRRGAAHSYPPKQPHYRCSPEHQSCRTHAEVQSFYGDGAVALHTRSLKYGKLAGGQLISVAPGLVRRQKAHFVHLDTIGALRIAWCCCCVVNGMLY